jgi:DNA adenine methylase
LVSQHARLFPQFTGIYIEPFLGSGAVFFHLQPKEALLSDKNGQLIETYEVVRDFPDELHRRLSTMHVLHNSSYYYQTRQSVPLGKIDRAARFIYLNRTCWNGLFRVNMKGQFNVPIGTKTTVEFPENALSDLSLALKHATIYASDFEVTINRAIKDDFVFIDPPYTVSHNNNGFIKYNDVLFSWADQIRLAGAVKRASARGAYVFVSNADHNEIVGLYSDLNAHTLNRASILSGKPEYRRVTSEAAFLNYLPSNS